MAQSQANSGVDCWGLSYGYDRYANLLSATVSKCTAPMLSISVNGANQITNPGFTYDAAGNLTGDGLRREHGPPRLPGRGKPGRDDSGGGTPMIRRS